MKKSTIGISLLITTATHTHTHTHSTLAVKYLLELRVKGYNISKYVTQVYHATRKKKKKDDVIIQDINVTISFLPLVVITVLTDFVIL